MTLLKQPIGFEVGNQVLDGEMSSWMVEKNSSNKAVYGVFNGGGPKGAAFAGAIREVESSIRWKSVAGTSAGAITACLLAAGYDGKTIEHISAKLEFSSLLDPFDLEDVKASARQWAQVAEPDWLTALIKQHVPSLIKAPENSELEQRLKERLNAHSGGWFGNLSFASAAETAHWGIWGMTDALARWTGWGWAESLNDATAMASLLVGSDENREAALLDLLTMVLGDRLPPAIVKSVMIENEQGERVVSQDKAFAVLLGIYYRAGAYKGEKIVNHIEDFLQQALRSKEDYDLNNPVTFDELPVELRVMAADISNQRLVSFPDGLLNYGYVDDETSERHYMNFSVATAVRASMAIPLVFEPVYLRDYSAEQEQGEQYAMLVDGGLLNNFPVNQFDNRDCPVYGFWLGENQDLVPALSTDRVSGFLGGLVLTTMGANDRYLADRMGDDLTLFALDLDIELTPDERTERLAQSQQELAGLNERITANNEVIKDLQQQIEIVSDDVQLVEFVQNRLNQFNVLANQLDNQLTTVKQLIDDLESGKAVTRLTETLDFSLTNKQIAQLVENGREGVRRVLGGA